jgi:hypothetical protein
MNLIYRKFDTSQGTIIIEHDSLDRRSEISKNILANPKKQLGDYIDKIRDPKRKILFVNKDLSVYTYDLSMLENNSLSQSEIKEFIQNIINKEQPDNTSEISLFFKSFDFETEIKYNIIHEFIFYNETFYLYYKISSNVSWMSFLKTDVTYTVRYIEGDLPRSRVVE